MAQRSFELNRRLGRMLVAHNIALLERDSTPHPEQARRSLELARLLERADDKPSNLVSWLIAYLDSCTATGAR